MKKKTKMKREKCSVKVAYGLRSQCDEGRWFRNQEQNKMEHMKGERNRIKSLLHRNQSPSHRAASEKCSVATDPVVGSSEPHCSSHSSAEGIQTYND